MSFTITPAGVADLPTVVAIERVAFSDPWSLQSFREALDHTAVYFACARSDGAEVVGYVVAWFVADEGEIANLAVAPDGWGQGIGKALLDAALNEVAHVLFVPDVGDHCECLSLRRRDFANQCVKTVAAPRRNDHRRPVAGQPAGGCQADTG